MTRVVGLVQARMGSSRLPNKMLLPLNGYPIIEWIYRRLSRCKRLDELVFAIPDNSTDDVLADYLRGLGANLFRGSEGDVLGRFFAAAKAYQASHVVRICADNPLICPVETDRLVDFFLEQESCDYAYNNIPRNNRYPDGFGAEILSFDLLEKIAGGATAPKQREHAFDYIWDHRQNYQIATFDPPEPRLCHPEIQLDVDTMEDYRRMQASGVQITMSALECLELFIKP